MNSNRFVQIMKVRQRMVLALLVAIALSAALLFSGCAASTLLASATPTVIPNEPVATPNALPVVSLYDEETIVTLYNQSIPAVVEIKTIVSGSESSLGIFRYS